MDNRLLAPDVVCWRSRVVKLKTADTATGFQNILKQADRKRKKPFYAKYLPPDEKDQRSLPGSSSATAWEAAAKLAFHLETQAKLPAKEPRGPRRSSEVSMPLPAYSDRVSLR